MATETVATVTTATPIVIPKFQVQVQSNFGDKKDDGVCPACRGSGWELYQPDPRELENVYGDSGLTFDFAKRCTKCNGINKESLDLTGVPDMYREADITKFKWDIYKVDMTRFKEYILSMFYQWHEWKKRDASLYLWSKTPGSGKTFLACCLGKSIMIKYGIRMKFITAPDYVDCVGDSYNREKGTTDPSQIYRECELLILDDVGAQMGKEWQQKELFKLINERTSNGLLTIYTSNYPPEGLNLDERTKSRIVAFSNSFSMPEESIRLKVAEERQAEFFKTLSNHKGVNK